MIAYITSIGETTTDLCKWSLERLGYKTVLIEDPFSSLAQKLHDIYAHATNDFLRVDADVVVNQNIRNAHLEDAWWLQFLTFSWYKQDVTHGGVNLISKHALPALRKNVNDTFELERPESHLYRLTEFHSPRRCHTVNVIVGIQDYRQDDLRRVRDTKARRKQDGYDWELAERLNEL